jgi:DNA modification methylase
MRKTESENEVQEVLNSIKGSSGLDSDHSNKSNQKDKQTGLESKRGVVTRNINDLIVIPEFQRFYSPQPTVQLMDSYKSNGQMTPIHITPDNEIINGYRMVDVIRESGDTDVQCMVLAQPVDIHTRILLNQYREKTIEDQVCEARQVFIKYPKRQGQKNPDGEVYKRDELISASLGNRWTGDGTIKKLEYVLFNDLESDVLSKGIVVKGWKVDPCHEFLTQKMPIDVEKNYGFTKGLKEGRYTISEANKLIGQRSDLDKEHQYSFVIPKKVTLYNEDCVELPNLLNHEKEVDLLLTSPGYWKLRKYEVDQVTQLGHEETKEEYALNISKIFNELYPTLKDSANVVINIGETYQDGVGQGIPFLLKENIEKHTPLIYKDTLLWSKVNPHPQGEKVKRPINSIEYLLWYVVDPKKSKYHLLTFPKKEESIKETNGAKDVSSDGKVSKKSKSLSKPYGKVMSHLEDQKVKEIILTSIGENPDVKKISQEGHPAIMSSMLPVTMTLMLSDENDLVCDPFAGSSVVGKCSVELNRRFIGTELSKKYFEIGCEMMKLGDENFNRENLDTINDVVYKQTEQDDTKSTAA